MPFVQGHLRKESVSVRFTSRCDHCGEDLEIEVDSELRCSVRGDADPRIFIPLVDFRKIEAPSIIDDF